MCRHTKTRDGPDVPRLYGSYKSRICVKCGRRRLFDWYNVPQGRWHKVEIKHDAESHTVGDDQEV